MTSQAGMLTDHVMTPYQKLYGPSPKPTIQQKKQFNDERYRDQFTTAPDRYAMQTLQL